MLSVITLSVIMLNDVMLSVVMLNDVMLSVVILNVVAPPNLQSSRTSHHRYLLRPLYVCALSQLQ